jgi:transcriptional regulator with XRE-family HTH domain
MSDTSAIREMPPELHGLGARLRAERELRGLSQRELARRVGLSASLISQIETGQTKPSVGTLYAVVTELGLSIDSLFRGDDDEAPAGKPAAPAHAAAPLGSARPVHPGERSHIDLASGVRWERLTGEHEVGVDFLRVVYEPGGASTSDGSLMRHAGREYGIVLSGRLTVQLGFERHDLDPGDSIAFDSTLPHRFANNGETPVEGVWFVVGRDASGPHA